LLRLPEAEHRLVRNGGRFARILGPAQRGGLRLDVGEQASERTVSLTDLAWVAVAIDDVAANGGVLDEARVNRVRYLEGTPKASTRWIDTGWRCVRGRAAQRSSPVSGLGSAAPRACRRHRPRPSLDAPLQAAIARGRELAERRGSAPSA
jgi:hypothetical protein